MKLEGRKGKCVALLCVWLALVSATTPGRAEDNVPEILRYAREYVKAEGNYSQPVHAGEGEHHTGTERRTVVQANSRQHARDALQIRQLQLRIQMLEREVKTRSVQMTSDAAKLTEENNRLVATMKTSEEKMVRLNQQLEALRQENASKVREVSVLQTAKQALADQLALRTAPDLHVELEQARGALKNKVGEMVRLNQALHSSGEKYQALNVKFTSLQKETQALIGQLAQLRASAPAIELTKLRTELSEKAAEVVRLTQDRDAEREKLKQLSEHLTVLQKEKQTLLALKDNTPNVKGDMSLKTAVARQAYATGVMFARDILDAKAGNQTLGVDLDLKIMATGLTDVLFRRHPLRLGASEIEKALEEVGNIAHQGFNLAKDKQRQQAADFLATFRKQKGAEKDASGFWYRVTYPGDGALLKPDDTLDVVVEESLTNGTVVSDMDKAGSSLRQKLRDFPPSFAAGLARLHHHGQITLVVPPDLAYGDKGFPPDVPPGATMVYRIRVANVIPAAGIDKGDQPPGKRK
ncbi:hypothetical protein DO659_24050 [Salmonella enterica subsp. enterica serovar Minnesota]|nr:hypothetical protein [Salmonella enterica subsp. enterica serovar Minnesota]